MNTLVESQDQYFTKFLLELLLQALQIEVRAEKGRGELIGVIPEYASPCNHSHVRPVVSKSTFGLSEDKSILTNRLVREKQLRQGPAPGAHPDVRTVVRSFPSPLLRKGHTTAQTDPWWRSGAYLPGEEISCGVFRQSFSLRQLGK